MYKVSLSADERALSKKIIMKRCALHAVTVEDFKLNTCNDRYQVISVSSECVKGIRHFLTSSGQIKDPKNVSSTDRERIRRD